MVKSPMADFDGDMFFGEVKLTPPKKFIDHVRRKFNNMSLTKKNKLRQGLTFINKLTADSFKVS